MPLYEYKALNRKGKKVKGIVDADNSKAARVELKKKGIYVTEVYNKSQKKAKAKGGVSSNAKVGIDDLSLATRQLATLLKANIPLVEALAIAADQSEHAALKEAFSDIRNQVNEGGTLHKALLKYPGMFNKVYVSMCEAGEMSGTLDVILVRLAEFTESQSELQAKLKSAMTYPVIMLSFMTLLVGGLFVFMIPQMKEIFEDNEELELPSLSKAVFATSDFLLEYWIFIVASFILSVFIFQIWKRSPGGSISWDRMVLKIPVFGNLIRMVAVARFTRTLATLLDGGVPMLNAMSIVRNVVDNETLAVALDEARDNISEGESIAGPLKRSGEFPPIVIHMVNIGEKTGELESMLTQVSDSYDFQVRNKVDSFTSILEPVMLVLMGLIVAVIVFAVVLPMLAMQNGV
ncbi:MAG: type II secretion system inner membrane protein GspF [Bdellovibrionales bacterium]